MSSPYFSVARQAYSWTRAKLASVNRASGRRPGGRRHLAQQPDPVVQIGGAGVAVDHGHRPPVRRRDQINLGVYLCQRLFQHHHGKDAGAGADVAGPHGHTVGGGHAGAGISLRRAERYAGAQRARRVQQPRPRLGQGAGVLTGAEYPGQQVPQMAVQPRPGQQLVKGGQHPGIVVAGTAVNRKDARRIPDAQDLLPRELPVQIARQRRQEVHLPDMVLPVEDGLVKVRHRPPLRNVEPEPLGQCLGRGPGRCVAPGAEGGQRTALPVKGQVTVHHRRDPQGAHRPQRFAEGRFIVAGQIAEGVLYAGPDLVEMVGPVPAFKTVLPVVGAGRQHGAVRPGQHRLDAGRTEFQAQRSGFLFKFLHRITACRKWELTRPQGPFTIQEKGGMIRACGL